MLDNARPRLLALLMLVCSAVLAGPVLGDTPCADDQKVQQIPTNLELCAELDPVVRKPSALPLGDYEVKLNTYLDKMCYRNVKAGWAMDKTVRDTGPFIATLADGQYTGTYYGTHAPVLIWYSPEMMAWLRANRPSDAAATPAVPAPIPDGAIMVKEMYSPPPASTCRVPDLLTLKPLTQGVAAMVRDSAASRDGWFWGALAWSGWTPDWITVKPGQPVTTAPAFSGFGQYCVNCHASARDNLTFASLSNIKDEAGTYLNFLSQDFFRIQSDQVFTRFSQVLRHDHLQLVNPAAGMIQGSGTSVPAPPPGSLTMPSQTYDHVWIPGNGPGAASAFVTSDQCVGCHTAGGTGLQYEMTVPGPDNLLVNLAPYGTWRTSPMGLAGRDPVFFAQLASETQTFHPTMSAKVQDTCLGCHGIQGQRQFSIDRTAGGGACPEFLRETLDIVPVPANAPNVHLAPFAALARDGVSCTACHRMVLGQAATDRFKDAPQNRCMKQRQDFFNPGLSGFASTFTGSFLVGAPDQLYGPFKDPKVKPMLHSLGITPVRDNTILSSELCGSCHTVHLPVLRNDETLGHVYEQTTYAEWAFSAFRTGDTPDGKLPFGAGKQAQSCQDCHMPKTDKTGGLFSSKIAAIQEHSNFPQVENGLPSEDIDLQVREGFARHTLVGLNVFLIDMADQFADIFGIPKLDPMMLAPKEPRVMGMGVPPLTATRDAMLDQAANRTATITVSNPANTGTALTATVTVTNKSGHKLPSGVGFRRGFVDFKVLDATGRILWESGRTDDQGVILDQAGQPIAGEHWWKSNCDGRVEGTPYQPHYQIITRQDQAQIYQELVTAPPAAGPASCGPSAPVSGPLTTSFLSICAKLKDNRLLPAGFLPLPARQEISHALGAGDDLAEESGPTGTGTDPDYTTGGGDTLRYTIPLADIPGPAASVEATLYYQATPPYFLEDRACTAKGTDTDRLAYMTKALKLVGKPEADWKLQLVSSGRVPVRR